MMKPFIGITCSHHEKDEKIMLSTKYYRGIQEAGGIPLLLCYHDTEDVDQVASTLDGLLLGGGGDIDPALLGEEPIPGLGEVDPVRDEYELAITRSFMGQRKPILGICRGIQIINVVMGGSLYQDLQTQKAGELLQHRQKSPAYHGSHEINLVQGTRLWSILHDGEPVRVNSFHHQAVKGPGEGLRISACTSDGVIEGIEGIHEEILGVQWHPEEMWEKNRNMLKIFQYFVGKSMERRNKGL